MQLIILQIVWRFWRLHRSFFDVIKKWFLFWPFSWFLYSLGLLFVVSSVGHMCTKNYAKGHIMLSIKSYLNIFSFLVLNHKYWSTTMYTCEKISPLDLTNYFDFQTIDFGFKFISCNVWSQQKDPKTIYKILMKNIKILKYIYAFPFENCGNHGELC
jgi:hypothetical protein